MPQMMPMMWFFIYIYLIVIMSMLTSFIYFFYIYKPTYIKKSSPSYYKWNWKW